MPPSEEHKQTESEEQGSDSPTDVAPQTALVPSTQEGADSLQELESKVTAANLANEGLADIPSELAILPLRSVVVYPLTALPLTVGRPRSNPCTRRIRVPSGALRRRCTRAAVPTW